MKIAVIDNLDSFVYNLVRYVRECEDVEVFVQRNNAIDYDLLDQCDAILLSPGPGIPDEAGELKTIIRRYSGTKGVLGVCLGHQAIAEVFGSKLERCPVPIHGKASVVSIDNDEALFVGLPGMVEVGRYHSWQVSQDGNSALKITARTEDQTIMAFRHVSHPTIGIQFHPESILTPTGRTMITNWINSLR
ncbi:MAG: aminodeoxychorismate/anthranilate synthase component II [Candidatus Fluviicola riflensis]|nr:MAG: aminodeoxychorismate/anthranilate synthase component II [Candidatus Fluviicola riflensis]OGS76883.1 MAG: aminodeoxychorismate/anthranilate synthase component II [Candidatus Fluviicola riflensis]OGS81813.1 MAG: aminodeoxychorismate/anthranilate synthase component II [Fluviicola sp. RIFCSPHIGHO2_01_FULL_43_53]OGS88612.1 MAG: aminodeoxychorismate/anthranilate synthase component II [Fluviicola sp. RIFCSPHIGHO2_12_FULL_43_24]